MIACGIVQKPGIFLNDPKSRHRFFFTFFTLIVSSGGELPVDKKCDFPAFCGCESILGRESTDVICCFHFLSSPFMLHSFPLMFLSFCFHVFHVPSLCIKIVKDTGLRKLCSNRSGDVRFFFRPKRPNVVFICRLVVVVIVVAIVFEACAGCHLQAS